MNDVICFACRTTECEGVALHIFLINIDVDCVRDNSCVANFAPIPSSGRYSGMYGATNNICCFCSFIPATLSIQFLVRFCNCLVAGNWANGWHLHTTNIEQKLLLGQPHVFEFNRVCCVHNILLLSC